MMAIPANPRPARRLPCPAIAAVTLRPGAAFSSIVAGVPTRLHRGFAAIATLALLAVTGCAAASAAPTRPTFSAASGTRAVVVTLGDSVMAGYGLDAQEAWPALLAQDDGIPVTNLACSGAGFTTTGSCGSDFPGLIPKAVAAHPAILLIQSSDNDVNAADSDVIADTAQTVHELHAALPDTLIVGLSTLWTQPSTPPPTIALSTDALRRAVDSAGGVFVDIGQPLHPGSGLLQADDEHPTPAGQRVLLAAITRALQRAGVTL